MTSDVHADPRPGARGRRRGRAAQGGWRSGGAHEVARGAARQDTGRPPAVAPLERAGHRV